MQLVFDFTKKFLSTPSARRATRTHTTKAKRRYISIHALREEGDEVAGNSLRQGLMISIHALREEGDRAARCGVSPHR